VSEDEDFCENGQEKRLWGGGGEEPWGEDLVHNTSGFLGTDGVGKGGTGREDVKPKRGTRFGDARDGTMGGKKRAALRTTESKTGGWVGGGGKQVKFGHRANNTAPGGTVFG